MHSLSVVLVLLLASEAVLRCSFHIQQCFFAKNEVQPMANNAPVVHTAAAALVVHEHRLLSRQGTWPLSTLPRSRGASLLEEGLQMRCKHMLACG